MRWKIGFGVATLLAVAVVHSGCLVVRSEDDESACENYSYQKCETYCDPQTCWQKCWEEEAEPKDCPSGETGGSCEDGADCPAARICVDGTCRPRGDGGDGPGGICQTCESAYDCAGKTARCVTLGPSADSGRVCSPTCKVNRDCPSGFKCVKSGGETIGQCLPSRDPDGSRSCEGIPGVECTSADDCGAGERCVENECRPPNDAECNGDDDCESGEVCRDLECVPEDEPECLSRSDCRSDEICVDGSCKSRNPSDGCVFNRECDDGALCVDGKCLSRCQDRSDCSAREYCREGLCNPIECRRNPDCPTGEICVEARCREGCSDDGDCGDGYVCAPNGYCKKDPNVECRTNAECARDEMCHDGSCVTPCSCNQDCPSGEVCNLDTGLCETPDGSGGDSCEDDCDCPSGQSCNDGTCG